MKWINIRVSQNGLGIMKLSAKLKKCVILFTILLFIQSTAFAQEKRLTNIKIANSRDNLLTFFNIQGMLPENIKKSILSGLPATFSFFINLYQTNDLWFDKKIAELRITHDIKYNTLKKEFGINRSWEMGKSRIAKTFMEAEQLLTHVNHLKVVSLSRLEKNWKYQIRIRVKAEVNKDSKPFYLRHVSNFIPILDFKTHWYVMDFIY